ncbi:hypothetical protein DH2020_040111 [Rehmannia glutinosa]|uniref:UDP-glucuronate decarboxylase n=1 Tax=Rehmannia glutinosa TaxID=99300 RepID=A0ABR0UUL4_REHGL
MALHEAIAQAILKQPKRRRNALLTNPTLLTQIPKTPPIPPQIPKLHPQGAAASLHPRRHINRLHFLHHPAVTLNPLILGSTPRISAGSRESVVGNRDRGELAQDFQNHFGNGNYNRYSNGVGRVPVGIGSKRKRIVVTGGAGFVGSHLVDKLIARGDDVIVIDNFLRGGRRMWCICLGIRGVRSCYDEGKRTAETLAMDYHRGAGVEVRIARIFNTYGPRMCLDDGRVVSNFVAQAIRKQPMTVYGDGKQTRSFQYVSDLVDGLVALMEGEHVGPFNLGNPGEFTMLELAEVVKETIDPSATIEFKPNTADDPHKRKPDITKAKELLNWEPKISLREGLPRMVNDFRNRILNEDEGKGN